MKRKRIVGVDVMGSDSSPAVLLDALASVAGAADADLVAIGTSEWASFAKQRSLQFVQSADFINMEENPLVALRRKKDSSIAVGLRLIKQNKLDSFVSAGSTGALVTAAKIILGTLPHILRPALLALMPTKKNPVVVLDVGANVQAKAIHLVQFAMMGAAYLQAQGVESPSIGILNIGSEAVKGTSELRLAYQELQAAAHSSLRFEGNIEGKSVFEGEVDVLVTDGFTGNVFLKTAEGIANLVLDRIYGKLSKEALDPFSQQLSDLKRHLHYAEYPGALLAGLRGIVIKCHGYSTPQAFASAVRGAIDLTQSDFLERFQQQLALDFLKKSS